MRPVVIGVLLVAALAGCGRSAPTHEESAAIDPLGQWVRSDGRALVLLVLLVSHGPRGAWVVESLGRAAAGQAANACWRVHVGSLHDSELVASSDADRVSGALPTHANLAPPQGLFLRFRKNAVVIVSGPEAEDPACPLTGEYVRKQGNQPTLSYRPSR